MAIKLYMKKIISSADKPNMDHFLKSKNGFNATKLVRCPNCSKENQKFARYCGCCGKPVIVDVSADNRYGKLGRFLQKICKNSLPHKTTAASLVGISMLGLTFFGINSLSAIQTATGPSWLQLRRHFSKSFRLTNNELDMLYAKVLHESPHPAHKVNVNDLIALELKKKKRLRNNKLRIFPNPFFSQPDRVLSSAKKNEPGFIYSDIALNHPAYKALNALHDIGLNVCGQTKELRPYDKITRADWYSTLNLLFTRLGLSPFGNNDSDSKRSMTNFELNESFAILRKRFALQPEETFAWASDAYYPSRLEAFAALSSLLQELY